MSALSDKARGGACDTAKISQAPYSIERETGGANSVLIKRDEMNTKYWQMLVT
jgi:hypothetical protein